jgi:nucleotide-binding universal stress UspA family protein
MTTTASTNRIVVGVDGSDQSRMALKWATAMSEATDAVVEVLSAWHFPTTYGWSYVAGDWNPEQDAKRYLEQVVDEVFPESRPPQLNLVVREGLAAKVLLDASKGAILLVVGSRGHGGFVGLLLGSVSAGCAEHATCPVLVVHGEREAPAFVKPPDRG